MKLSEIKGKRYNLFREMLAEHDIQFYELAEECGETENGLRKMIKSNAEVSGEKDITSDLLYWFAWKVEQIMDRRGF